MSSVIDCTTAPHYLWQEVCDGWRLLDEADLAVTEEQMPAGRAERRHRHAAARQLFYVLSGALHIERDGSEHRLTTAQALAVPPGAAHQVSAPGPSDVRFLVISAPSTRHDREDL